MKIIDVSYGSNSLPFNTSSAFKKNEFLSSKTIKQQQQRLERKSVCSETSDRSSISNISTSNNEKSCNRCSSSASSSSSTKTNKNALVNVENWTKNDVSIWVNNVCYDYGLPLPYPLDQFPMNGKGLLMLKKEDFIYRSPLCGDVLYECLKKILKKNSDLCSLNRSNSSLNSVSSCKSSEASFSSNSSTHSNSKTDQLQRKQTIQGFNSIETKVEIPKKSRYTFPSDYDILNQCDNNLYGYLKYLNDSFMPSYSSNTKSSASTTNGAGYNFGVKATKIVYQLNANQMHLYANINNNTTTRVLLHAA